MLQKKKILFFLQDGVGGAERISVLLGKSLPTKEFNVTFCLVERGGDTSIRDFIPEGYKIIKIPNAGPLKMMWQLFNVIRKQHPHIVFSSVMYLNTKILPFRCFFPSTRFVVRCENYLYTFNKKQHRRIRMTYRSADAIIAQTQEMADELTEQMNISKDKVFVMQNPVDTKLINRLVKEGGNPYPENGKKHFVASGRFAYQKGFDLLLEAFIKVQQQRQDVDLYIIGDYNYNNGEVYSQLMTRAKESKIDNIVHCVGYQKNPYPYIKYADCFVLSSRWEGLPNVLIEALYLGTPATAFKCIPVVERIINDGVSGYLASKENVNELAFAMTKALSLGRVENSYKSSSIEDFIKVLGGGQKITSYRQMKYWVRLDLESYEMQHPFAARFTYGENWELFSYMKNLRHLEYHTNKSNCYPWDKMLKTYYWLRHRRDIRRTLISIAPNCVGPGLHLVHRGFRRLGGADYMHIGKNCTCLPNVLLGKKTPESKEEGFWIGDNCYIGTGVTILGPIHVGDNVVIGAGAVVTKNIPNDCTVAGVPAKIIKQD